MLSLLPWDSGHVRWLPCEDVPILPEEGDERAFLCRVEAGPDHGGLVRFIIPEDDGIGRYGWHELRLGSRLLGGDDLLVRQEVLCCLGNKNGVPGSFQVLVFCNVTNKICKRTDTAVAFTQEYSRVSYSLGNVSTLPTGSGYLRTHTLVWEG